MTKRERDLLEQARTKTNDGINAVSATNLDQESKNKIFDPLSEALSILGGMLVKLPKDK